VKIGRNGPLKLRSLHALVIHVRILGVVEKRIVMKLDVRHLDNVDPARG
jgi:hypothetical protein